MDSDFAAACNNDHVLPPDGREVGLSHHSADDGKSRIYRVGAAGGRPELVTPLGPSYLHGWSSIARSLRGFPATSGRRPEEAAGDLAAVARWRRVVVRAGQESA